MKTYQLFISVMDCKKNLRTLWWSRAAKAWINHIPGAQGYTRAQDAQTQLTQRFTRDFDPIPGMHVVKIGYKLT